VLLQPARDGKAYRGGSAPPLSRLSNAYRRKWATERKELPLKDVAAAGGWKDVTTLLTCYQHAGEATMLKVMEFAGEAGESSRDRRAGETVAAGETRRRPNTTEVAPGIKLPLLGSNQDSP
jgi:hypothetical protein